MTDLFSPVVSHIQASQPLAERMRPVKLHDLVGQSHIVGKDGHLRRMMQSSSLSSLIFWGPPGTGKTTAARLLANDTALVFHQISAILSGVAELKKIFETARVQRAKGLRMILFVDEIHRFNRAQQDSFLPVMEDGTVILVGATTENPSFALNAALLSRAQILSFKPLDKEAINQLLERAERIMERKLPLDACARACMVRMADGDGRAALMLCEDIWRFSKPGDIFNSEQLQSLLQRRAPIYDKGGDGHYNLISALHKAVRGSDPDAALYYLSRMLVSGEDPHYIGRRIVRMASEDIGLADPQALTVAQAAKDAYENLGSPEGELALAQACVYLATAPKSNAIYVAYKAAMKAAKTNGSLAPPKHILNAPTKLLKTEGYGEGYQYDHDAPDAFSGQSYFPDVMQAQTYYHPVERGFEREIRKRLDYWRGLKAQRNKS